VTHGDGLEKYVQPVREALALAREYADENFGWQPTTPVCIHLFDRSGAFVEGLQQAGWSKWNADEYRAFWGTVGIDPQTLLDAAYIDAGVISVPELVARTAVHEYIHIVQGHVGGTRGGASVQFPQWFIEGMAYWEVDKIMGVRYRTWLTLVQEDVRAGRDAPLASLTTWDQYLRLIEQARDSSKPNFIGFKLNAAFMFLEEIAGPTAPAQILRRSTGHGALAFEDAFREVTGLTLPEFEAKLREFIMQQPP